MARAIPEIYAMEALSDKVVLNIVDPDVVVLGGGMSQIARLYESVPPLAAAAAAGVR